MDSQAKKDYMELAFAEAKKAEAQDEVPIGAVIVAPDGKVIGRGYNRRELDQDATQHAEIIAIRQANQNLGTWRLENCSLFVTLEPCPMCAGAIINARIKDVYFGALDPKAGAVGSVVDLFAVEKFNHHPHAIRGLYRNQASHLLKAFFQKIRQRQKAAKANKKSGNN